MQNIEARLPKEAFPASAYGEADGTPSMGVHLIRWELSGVPECLFQLFLMSPLE